MAASDASRRAQSSPTATRRSRLAIALAVAAAAEAVGGVLVQRACAASTVDTFTGGTSGAWETGPNWSNSAPPGNSTTNALINFSSGVTFTGAGGFNTAGLLEVGVGDTVSGVNATGNGALIIGNGTLTVTGFNVGDGGNSSLGTVTVNGGNLTVTGGTDYIGQSSYSAAPGSGTLNVISGSVNAGGQEIDIGDFGNGTLNVSGGNLTTTGIMYVNSNGNVSSNAVANVSGGILSIGQLYVAGAGASDTNTQFFNQSAGNVTVTTSGSNDFRIGRSSTTPGVYNLTGGTLTTYTDLLLGTNINSNGTLNVGGGALFVGNSTNASSLHVGGSTVTNNASSAYLAVVNQTGGNVTIGSASTSGLFFDSASTGTGTRLYSLEGGTLTTPLITAGAIGSGGNNVFNFNGGTLQAQTGGTATQYASFMSGLTNATIYSGNATINTNGQNITIAQPLLAPTESGLTGLSYTGGTGYYGAPRVIITGGTGIPATAVVVLDSNGNVTGITITSPGSYSSLTGLTISLTGNLQPGGTPATITGNTTALNTSGGLYKTGTGILTLTGSNNYSGVTTISTGTLEFANENSLYGNTTASWTAANIPVSSGATLALGVGGTGQFTNADVTTLLTNLDGAVNNNGLQAGSIIGFDTTGGNFTLSNTVANTTGTGGGSVGLTKLGTNTLVLSASNSYTGPTNINGGTLSLGNTSALAGGGNITFTGGTLQFTGNNTNDYSSKIVSSTSAPISIDTNGQTVNFTGTLASSNTDGLVKTGAGTLFLQGPQSYSGGVVLSAGTLAITQGPGLGAVVTSPVVQLTFAGNSTLQIRSATQFLSGRTFAISTGVTGSIDTDGTTGNTLPQLISGNGTLAKIGLGDMALQGNNTYAGGTTVSVGTLFANNTTGSATGSGNINVAASTAAVGNATTWYTGGTFSGNGNVSGAVTLAASTVGPKLGGTIAAGGNSSSIGTLTTGNQTWNGGAAYQWKISNAGTNAAFGTGNSTSGSWDSLKMSGLSIASGGGNQSFTIALNSLSSPSGSGAYSWVIAQTTTAPTGLSGSAATLGADLLNLTPTGSTATGSPGSYAVFALDTTGFGNGFSLSGANSNNFSLEFISASGGEDLVLDYSSAPEPGTAILASLGAVPLLGARRRRRRPVPAIR